MSLTICNDGHRCLNGGLCTPNPNDDGAFYCDCDSAVSVVSGLSCEHDATTYCTYKQEVSKVSFCTNKGECQVEVEPGDSHIACKCPDGYEGEHCQFIEGSTENAFYQNTLTRSAPQYSIKSMESDSDAVVVLVVVLVMLVLSAAVLYVYNKKRMLSTPLTRESTIPVGSAEMALDSDGGILQESLDEKNLEESDDNAVINDQAINGNTHSSTPNGSNHEDYSGELLDVYDREAHNGEPDNGEAYNGEPNNGEPYNGEPYNGEATTNGDDEKGQMEEIQISNSNEII